MKPRFVVALSMLSGALLGAIAVQGLHAQAKPPAYAIAEVEASDAEAYAKDFAPLASKATLAAGGKFLARGGKTLHIEGAPPSSRVLLIAFDSLEQAQAAFAAADFRDAKKIGDKFAKFRIWAVEGVAK